MKILLPNSIDLDLLFSDLPTKPRKYNPSHQLKKDEIAIIIYTILRRIAYNQEEYKKTGYVRLNSKRLEKYCKSYKEIFTLLEKHKIITIDGTYIPGEISKGYGLVDGILTTDLYEHEIMTQKLIKRNEENSISPSNGEKHIEKLIYWLKRVTIEEKEAIEKLEQMVSNNEIDIWKYYQNRINVNNILTNQWYFKRDDTAGRIHTNITNLKKELRTYLSINGIKLVEKDISNCQPLVSIILLHEELRNMYKLQEIVFNRKKSTMKGSQQVIPFMFSNIQKLLTYPDVRMYIDLVVNKKIYPFLLTKYNEKYTNMPKTLKEIKRLTLASMFSPSIWNTNITALMRENFPSIMEIFDQLKIGFNKTKHGNGYLKRKSTDPPCLIAIVLQSLEVELVIHQIVPEIIDLDPNIPILTIHDSILSHPEYIDRIKVIMDTNIRKITEAFKEE